MDAVKVQIIDADKSYARSSASYDIFKKVQMSLDDWRKIAVYAREIGMDMFATFTHPDDIAIAEEFQSPAIKISSSNLTNFLLLKAASRAGKPLIVSTGLSYLSEVDEAVRYLEAQGQKDIALLHCTSLYPAPAETVHLRAMNTLQAAFPRYPVGLSDHTMGLHCSVAAVALGARILEKHFTLDRAMEGPDHHFSATPQELAELVCAVHEVERALGSATKQPVTQELPEREKLQRKLVALKDIGSGEPYTSENIGAKRASGGGLSPKYFEVFLGKCARNNIKKDEAIKFDMIG